MAKKTKQQSIYRRFADKVYPGIGRALYRQFDLHNDTYFVGELRDKPLLIGITPYGRAVGVYDLVNKSIMLHKSYQREFVGFITDELSYVILHEMMHAWLHQEGKYEGVKDLHGEVWADECNRIAPMIFTEKVWYTTYKRVKTPLSKGGKKNKRSNVYEPTSQAPEGYRLASKKELLQFPSLTIQIQEKA